jgi:hypothetical protein
MKYSPDEFAADGAFGQFMELAPQALAAEQEEGITGHVRPCDAPDPFGAAAAVAGINDLAGAAGVSIFDQSHRTCDVRS